MTSWCILLTSPSQTIALAEALQDAGIDAWTPVETVRPEVRATQPWERDPTLRRRKRPELVTRPLLPTYVFADASRSAQLAEMAHSPSPSYRVWDSEQRRMVTKGHPYFRVFRPEARPMADRELDALRRIERRRKPRGLVPSFKAGDAVKLTEGAYGGLRGTVVRVKNKTEITVHMPGFAGAVDIAAWLLISDVDFAPDIHQSAPQSERGDLLGDAA